MKETVTCRYMLGRWWDQYAREDGSITFREIPNFWSTWPEKYKQFQKARKK